MKAARGAASQDSGAKLDAAARPSRRRRRSEAKAQATCAASSVATGRRPPRAAARAGAPRPRPPPPARGGELGRGEQHAPDGADGELVDRERRRQVPPAPADLDVA